MAEQRLSERHRSDHEIPAQRSRAAKGPKASAVAVSFSTPAMASHLEWNLAPALINAARTCAGDPEPILGLLASCPESPPTPGQGRTVALWEFLATLASVDLAAARTVEPHLDAAAILAQAGLPWPAGCTWGVFAAEGRPKLVAAAPAQPSRPWVLEGQKPWCSLAATLDRAVVTAHVPGGRRAFMVDLKQPGVIAHHGHWASHGLNKIHSEAVQFNGARAFPIGPTDWYLARPGFAVGGVGVAACWFGGAVGIFRDLFRSAQSREPDQLALAWLGEADRMLASGAAMLHRATQEADQGSLDEVSAQRVRGQVAGLCERIIAIAGQAMGPGPLGFDHQHARRVADLGIYIRQHHASRDDAALGGLLLKAPQAAEGGSRPW
ncbi:acyl-CoA dehydrogenase [Paeniglutamicibacter sulfureus]|uniref:Alkylation response protein AidB-like acyl-CoA dehydrogenase n=1 Tax=Paeniglutamicibacter sulfureus TaxID=43666 RepID=A0ABU2BNU8_9MICC|nr:acyl-CoA dehydrogenase [Paeniglutamicibacter sulfureus]MDR7360337.1 alkylation response protein AidB-like acyl-CoA dehydrogenase [Paeniglutamicibacter sulfureus]